MDPWFLCWLLFPPPAFWVCPNTTIFALSRFVASDSTKCSSLALAMIALLVRLLYALALSWSLALFTCGSLDCLNFCSGHDRSACAPPRCACFIMVSCLAHLHMLKYLVSAPSPSWGVMCSSLCVLLHFPGCGPILCSASCPTIARL